MDESASKLEGRRLSARLLAAVCLVAIAAVGATAWLVHSHFEPTGLSSRPAIIFGPSPTEILSRTAILGLVPAPGGSLVAHRVALPDVVAAAVKTVPVPMADPILVVRSDRNPDTHLILWLQQTPERAHNPSEAAKGLGEILGSTTLGWKSLFELGRAYADYTGDESTAEAFYCAGVANII